MKAETEARRQSWEERRAARGRAKLEDTVDGERADEDASVYEARAREVSARNTLVREEQAVDRSVQTGMNGGKLPGQSVDGSAKINSSDSIDYLKRSLEQIAASRDRGRGTKPKEDWLKDLSPDELKLIGEILQEYLT